jgi:aspartate/methionine/tyrosine aminotransferase
MNRLSHFHAYWENINALSAEQKTYLMDFGMGMPTTTVFHSPEVILKKLHESIEKGEYNRYIPTEGGHELLAEIAEYESRKLPSETGSIHC